jgi:hypothetical protein
MYFIYSFARDTYIGYDFTYHVIHFYTIRTNFVILSLYTSILKFKTKCILKNSHRQYTSLS